jgi:hypothetical protein
MTIPCFEVTLVYADGSTWLAGSFQSLDDANAWVTNEKAQPYWVATTQANVVDKSYTITPIT